jgi:hypothetical protein
MIVISETCNESYKGKTKHQQLPNNTSSYQYMNTNKIDDDDDDDNDNDNESYKDDQSVIMKMIESVYKQR